MKHKTFDSSPEVQLIFYAFLYHSTLLLRFLYQTPSSQPPVKALHRITCAGGIPRACSRADKHCAQPLWSRSSYKHFSETTSVSVCRLRVFVTQPHFTKRAKEKSGAGRNAFTLHARARSARKECSEPARGAHQNPPSRGTEATSPLPLTTRGSIQDQTSHQLHCSCQVTISRALM